MDYGLHPDIRRTQFLLGNEGIPPSLKSSSLLFVKCLDSLLLVPTAPQASYRRPDLPGEASGRQEGHNMFSPSRD